MDKLSTVFLLDQSKGFEEIISRLKKLIETIEKMDPEEYRLFMAWKENILSRGLPPEKKDEISGILKKNGEMKLLLTGL